MKKHLFKSLFLMAMLALWGTGAWADEAAEWSIDFAAIGANYADKTAVTISTENTVTIGGTLMGTCSVQNEALNENFVIQTGTNWLMRRTSGLYQGNGGPRSFGMKNCTKGQLITIVGTGDPNVQTNATLKNQKENTYTYTVSEDGDVGFCPARYLYFTSIAVSNPSADAVSYTVKYVDGEGSEIKTPATYDGKAGDPATISDTDKGSIIKDGVKYIYDSDDSEGKLIDGSGNTVITIKFRVADTWSWTLAAKYGNNVKQIGEGTVYEGESAYVTYPLYYFDEILYTKASEDTKTYNHKVTPTGSGFNDNIQYEDAEIDNVVFFSEAEDIATLEPVVSGYLPERFSAGKGAYAKDEAQVITTLQPGKYKLTAMILGTASACTFTFKAGETTVWENTTDGNSFYVSTGITGEEFTITKTTDITLLPAGGDGSSTRVTNSVDWLYIQKTGDVEEEVGWRDIKVTLADANMWESLMANGATVYITVAEDETIGTTDDADKAAATLKGMWHSTGYGWSNFTASVPVEGCVKISYGTHDYGNDVTVTNSNNEVVAKLNNTGAKWSSNPSNVIVAYYRTNAPTTLNFSNCNYLPYFAVEAIDEADLPAEITNYTVTFAAGEGNGAAPKTVEVNAGDKLTAPKNYTLYKDGATLTGWSDGTTTYAVGAEITPEADMTLTAVYTANEVSLNDRTEAVTLTYALDGYNDNPKYNYQGNNGIMVTQATVNGKTIDVKADVDATEGKFAHNGSGWHQVNTGTKVTVPSCKDATIAVTTYNDASSVNFNGGTDGVSVDGTTATYTAMASDETALIAQVSNNYWNKLTITLPVASEEPAEWVYRDFEIDPLGDLLTADEKQQGTELSFGVIVNEDGTQTRVAANNAAANVVLSGTYHNDHGWRNFKAVVPVPGSVKITMSTCSWGGSVTVTNANSTTVAEFSTQKGEGGSGCYGGGKSEDPNTVSAKYNGGETTLTISGGAYVNYFAIEKIEDSEEPVSQDITGTWTYSNEEVMTATMALSGSNEAGEVDDAEKNGLKMTVLANGATFRNNGNSIQVRSGAVFRIPVKNAGDLVTVNGYPGYSFYTIGNSTVELNDVNTYTAKISDAEVGYVAVTSVSDNNYYNSISVVQYAPKEKVTLDNEMATVNFPFNLGTEGQTATFSNPDYFLNSKVAVGSNFVIEDKNSTSGFDQTRLKSLSKESSNSETNLIQFVFTPKPGLTFTPTKVSFKATRYGTDGGKMTVSWQNPDKTLAELGTDLTPNRENGNDANKQPTGIPYSEYSYDITNTTPGEGTCGLAINIHSLDPGKRYGFADILIEGTLNGTEKDLPILASFKVNGNVLAVEDVFGEEYEATLELPKAEPMVSAQNPLTEVTATNGEVGEITYQGTETTCTVTIPVTAGETQLDYVLNVVQKPDFTLTYYDTDGSVMGTQNVEKDAAIGEFAIDYTTAKADDGYKVRGWFVKESGGRKYTTAEVITADTKLYAVATEIEGPSDFAKYTFNLADQYFYAEDHEAFNPTGGKFHDTTHGWDFVNGNTIDLLVGAKATITITICKYSNASTSILVKDANGQTLETLNGVSDTDGDLVAYNYEGEPGTLTLEIQAGGAIYIHNIKIANTGTTNYDSDGQWIYVKAGNAKSLIDAIEGASAMNADQNAERRFIFVPNGTYDLGTTCLTAISGHNLSLVGESMEGVIIKNKPEAEGIGVTATLLITGQNTYLQDLTLKNDWDYYGGLDAGGSAGRAVCIQDKSTSTICKNVTLLSHQDTYYTNNNNGKYYWETSDIHGTVDFICGEGTLFVEKSTLTVEKRNSNGKGGCTLTAPSTAAGKTYGYVFNNCTIDNYAESYNLGRAWQNEPRCAFLNTTVSDDKISSSRWNSAGINNGICAKEFVEYNTMNTSGSVVSPASKVINFTDKAGNVSNQIETILTATQAANFTLANVFGDWAPDQETKQTEASDVLVSGTTMTWTAADDAIAYAICQNGAVVDFTTETTYDLTKLDASSGVRAYATGEDNSTPYSIRAANKNGGLGTAIKAIIDPATGINEIAPAVANDNAPVYNTAGQRVDRNYRGIVVVNGKKMVKK